MKTIKDVTKNDVARLAEAAMNALGALRFLLWVEDVKDDDGSYEDAQSSLADALEAIGLPQNTRAEFNANIESTLKLSPEEFRSSLHERGLGEFGWVRRRFTTGAKGSSDA